MQFIQLCVREEGIASLHTRQLQHLNERRSIMYVELLAKCWHRPLEERAFDISFHNSPYREKVILIPKNTVKSTVNQLTSSLESYPISGYIFLLIGFGRKVFRNKLSTMWKIKVTAFSTNQMNPKNWKYTAVKRCLMNKTQWILSLSPQERHSLVWFVSTQPLQFSNHNKENYN